MTFTVRLNGDTNPANWIRDIAESSLPQVVAGLAAGSYQVRREAASSWSAAVTVSAAATVPAAFGAGQWALADAATGGALSVTVSALPSDGGSALTAIQYRVNSGAWTAFAPALAGTGTRTITGLANGSAQTVELRAVNAVGAGADSDDKSATPTVAPGLPGAFVAGNWTVAAGNASASVTVSALPAANGSAITAVQYRLNGGAWTAFSPALAGTGTRTITGLTNGTAYTVELRAVNGVGGGADSDDKSVTPAAPAGNAHVHFGGTTTIYAPQPSPVLTTTETALTFVGRYRITTTPAESAQILFNTSAVQLYQDGSVQLSVNGAHGFGSTTPPATGAWTSFMLAVSSSANINGVSRRLWVNGTERLATAAAGGPLDASFGFTFMGFEYVADNIAIGDVEGIWMARGLLNPETHWTNFFESDGTLKTLSAGGAVGGVSPFFHMRGDAAAWNALVDLNGHAFTRSGPAVTDAA